MRGRAGSIRLAFVVAVALAVEVPAQNGGFNATSLCELLKSPRRSSGRLVSVRTQVFVSPEFVEIVDPDDETCGGVTIADPSDKGVDPKPDFRVVQDSQYKLFDQTIIEMLVRRSNRLTATFEGRFDWAFWPWQGFGHLNRFKGRVVVYRIRDVEATPTSVRPPQ